MFLSTVMVSPGTVLSSTWISAANSWMQTPAGFDVVHGQLEPTDWIRVIFNPSFLWRRPHLLAAVLISASFFVAGITTWYLVKGRAKGFSRRSMSIAFGDRRAAGHTPLLAGADMDPDVQQRGRDERGVQQRGRHTPGPHSPSRSRGDLSRPARSRASPPRARWSCPKCCTR